MHTKRDKEHMHHPKFRNQQCTLSCGSIDFLNLSVECYINLICVGCYIKLVLIKILNRVGSVHIQLQRILTFYFCMLKENQIYSLRRVVHNQHLCKQSKN